MSKMKPENQPISNQNLTEAEIADQQRNEAAYNFMHPENKKRTPQKSWLKRNLGKILTIGGLVAVVGAGACRFSG